MSKTANAAPPVGVGALLLTALAAALCPLACDGEAPSASECVDADGDGFGPLCQRGPDCDDTDPTLHLWLRGYVDEDGDGYGAGAPMLICVAAELGPGFARRGGDCDDGDPAALAGCPECRDEDGDGWAVGCPEADQADGPDCDDRDRHNWRSCLDCQDRDRDGCWTGCDSYGPDRPGPDPDDTTPGACDGGGHGPPDGGADGGVSPDGGVVADGGPGLDAGPPADAEVHPGDGGEPDGAAGGPCPDPGLEGFGPHFQAFLDARGDSDLTGFGGSERIDGPCAPQHDAVIFVHGNADDAAGRSLPLGGWATSRARFMALGHRPTELYALDWGLPGVQNAWFNTHTGADVGRVYRFVAAVADYTGGPVDLIAHSMGVTLARRALEGGRYAPSGSDAVQLGDPLTERVDTFVGIAGGNRGLNSCGVWPLASWLPGCGPDGSSVDSPFLLELNGGSALGERDMRAGQYTFSLRSYVDEFVCAPTLPLTCLVYGRHTSALDGEDGSRVYTTLPFEHMGLKELTADVQHRMVVEHRTD